MILDDRAGRRHDQPYVTVFLSDSHVDLQMLDDGVSPDAFAGDHLYVAHLEFEEAQAVEVLMLEGAPSPLGDVFSQSSRQLVEGRNRWKVDSEEQLGPADELLDEAAPLEFEISLEEAARRRGVQVELTSPTPRPWKPSELVLGALGLVGVGGLCAGTRYGLRLVLPRA
ncbi:MAG TPA: hypothetical protein QGF58_29025 [Myxococcota bacterium]|nr:hypothetical protein [Myxococcota bacterium]